MSGLCTHSVSITRRVFGQNLMMVDVANVPEHDKFQIIRRHAKNELVYPAGRYLVVIWQR